MARGNWDAEAERAALELRRRGLMKGKRFSQVNTEVPEGDLHSAALVLIGTCWDGQWAEQAPKDWVLAANGWVELLMRTYVSAEAQNAAVPLADALTIIQQNYDGDWTQAEPSWRQAANAWVQAAIRVDKGIQEAEDKMWDELNGVAPETPKNAYGKPIHPSVEAILQHFDLDRTGSGGGVLQYVHDLAHLAVELLDSDPELTVGLRKLLEAQECFIRAARVTRLNDGG